LEEGFCSNRIVRATAAFIAMDSKEELEANVLCNLASLDTKNLPALPTGTLKRFGLQYTISSYEALRELIKVSES
jgi:hypothetical protein